MDLQASNRKISESEEKYHSLVEHAGDSIFLLNEDTSFNDLNTSACKLLGYSREKFLRLRITDVFSSEESTKPPQWESDRVRKYEQKGAIIRRGLCSRFGRWKRM